MMKKSPKSSHPAHDFPKVPFNKPFVAGNELARIAQCVADGHMGGNGGFCQACEGKLEELCGGTRVLMTPSCTSALEIAFILADVKPGDEVIMPSFAFVSAANAIVLRGGIPVFCDIRADTFNLDEAKIESCITPKTRAILPVHYAGQACQMTDILDISRGYGLIVIEDAAQAIGAYRRGKHLGTFGKLAAFSFHETKNINCGEGGALAINDESLVDRAEIIRDMGTNRAAFLKGKINEYSWVDVGSSYHPSELQMAFLLGQLDALDQVVRRRKNAYQHYYERLEWLEEREYLQRPVILDGNQINYHLYPILCRSGDERSRLIPFLRNRGIQTVFHYIPLHDSIGGKRFASTPIPLAVTESISRRLLRLPLFADITLDMVDRVVDGLEAYFRCAKS